MSLLQFPRTAEPVNQNGGRGCSRERGMRIAPFSLPQSKAKTGGSGSPPTFMRVTVQAIGTRLSCQILLLNATAVHQMRTFQVCSSYCVWNAAPEEGKYVVDIDKDIKIEDWCRDRNLLDAMEVRLSAAGLQSKYPDCPHKRQLCFAQDPPKQGANSRQR